MNDVGTDPHVADTDGDGIEDFGEVNPPEDGYATDPNNPDSDGDTVSDGDEISPDNGYVTDPNNPDTDGDGIRDDEELEEGDDGWETDPTSGDSDSDGIPDGEEVAPGDDSFTTNPNSADSDGDGFTDAEEIAGGGHPSDDTEGPRTLGDNLGNLRLELEAGASWDATSGDPVATGRVRIGCIGSALTTVVDGTLQVRRAGDTVEVSGVGDVELLLPGSEDTIVAWTGDVAFDIDSTTGVLDPETRDETTSIDSLDGRVEFVAPFDEGLLVDVCDGILTAPGSLFFHGPDSGGEPLWSVEFVAETSMQPSQLSLWSSGDVSVVTPFGDVELAESEFSVSLSHLYVSGSASLVLPQFDGVDLSGPAADFTLDIENGVLEFHVNSSVEAEIGPLTIALEGGPAAAIELDAPRGYIYVEGGFEFHPVAFFGRVGLDLSGQIVFEPLHLIEDSCVDDIDLEQDGHVLVGVEADVPIPVAPVLSVGFAFDYLIDVATTPDDGDPLFAGANGTFSMGAGFGPVSLGLEVGGATAAMLLDDDDEIEQVVLVTEQGLRLDDVFGDAAGILGSIGSGSEASFCYDVHTGTLAGGGIWYQQGWEFDWDFEIVPPMVIGDVVDTSTGGISGSGDLAMPLGLSSVELDGSIGWDGEFELTGTQSVSLVGHTIAGASFTLDNDGLSVAGELDLGPIGGLDASGFIESDGDFALALSGTLNVAGHELSSVTGELTNEGVAITGFIDVPGFGSVRVTGNYYSSSDFLFEGDLDLTIGGYDLAGADVSVDPTSATVDARLNLPGDAGGVDVFGQFESDGHILLAGSNRIEIGGYGIHATLSFERFSTGSVAVIASGNLSLGSLSAASGTFSWSSDGDVSGSGSLSFAGLDISVDVDYEDGDLDVSGSISIEGSFIGADLSGSLTVSYDDGIEIVFSGTVEAGGLDMSVSKTVSISGCFDVAGFPYWCPTWTDPDRICTYTITVCLD